MDEHSSRLNLDEADLLELALRLATYPDDARTQKPQILPGQLPDQLPVEIPLPEDSRVLGSLTRNPESFTIILDTHLSPEQVLTFYDQRMSAAGWQTPQPYRPDRGGFLSSGPRDRGGYAIFYQGLHALAPAVNTLESFSAWHDDGNLNRTGPSLSITAYKGRGNVTDARLNLEMNAPVPPALLHMRGRSLRHNRSILPALEAPEGAKLAGGGASSHRDNAEAHAILETSMDLATLAAHYKAQLEQSGCVLTGGGQQAPFAWHTWTLQEDDEQWHGFFLVLQALDQECSLWLRMKRDGEDRN